MQSVARVALLMAAAHTGGGELFVKGARTGRAGRGGGVSGSNGNVNRRRSAILPSTTAERVTLLSEPTGVNSREMDRVCRCGSSTVCK